MSKQVAQNVRCDGSATNFAPEVDSGILSTSYSSDLSSLKDYMILNSLINDSMIYNNFQDDSADFEEFPNKKVNSQQQKWKYYHSQKDNGKKQIDFVINQDLIEATYSLNSDTPLPYFLLLVDNNGQTALHIAVLRRQPTTVRQLIIAGADPAVRDSRGNTALHLACASGDLDCARALTHPLFTPAEQSMLKPGIRLPPLPQSLDLRNQDGDMCHHIAVLGGNIELVRRLMGCGADMAARRGRDGNTALHIAIETHQHDMVTMLLYQPKFNLNIRNLAGESAYEFALRHYEFEIAEKLAKLGVYVPENLRLLHLDDDCFESENEEFDSEEYFQTPVLIQFNINCHHCC